MQTLIKQPSESRLFSMDFSPLLSPGESVDSVTSVTASPAGLTLSGNAVRGVFAEVRAAGGTDSTRYKVTFVVVSSAGNTLESEGVLLVKDL